MRTQTSETPLGLFASVANFKVVNIKPRLAATCRRRPLAGTLNIDVVKLCRLFIDRLQPRNGGGRKKNHGRLVHSSPGVISLISECGLNVLPLHDSWTVIPGTNKQLSK